jgi:putative transposase
VAAAERGRPKTPRMATLRRPLARDLLPCDPARLHHGERARRAFDVFLARPRHLA